MRVVIIGGSAAGLATALVLARAGHEVDVVDRDGLEPAANVEAAAEAAFRPAAPQLVHAHQYMPLARRILLDQLPEVYSALLRAGAVESPVSDRMPPSLRDRSARPGDEDLTALQARRSTFDWVLRTAAATQRGVHLNGGTRALGLLTSNDDPPRARGVRTERGDLRADVVVDAAGRRSPVDGWLAAVGAQEPHTLAAECGVGYYTRHYRLRADAVRNDAGRLSMVALLPFFTVAAFGADNGTLTLAFCPLLEDKPLRALRAPAVHEAMAHAVPGVRSWLDAAEPISGVHAMGGLRNSLRRLVVGGRPVVLGLHAVGDSVSTTNPTLGRGLPVALQGATDLAEVLAEHPDDPEAQAHAMDDAVTAHIAPWYTDQATFDSARLTAVRDALGGRPQTSPPPPTDGITPAHLRAAAAVDPDVFRALTSLISMVRYPDEVYNDPDTHERVRAVFADHPLVPPPARPSRAEILAAVATTG